MVDSYWMAFAVCVQTHSFLMEGSVSVHLILFMLIIFAWTLANQDNLLMGMVNVIGVYWIKYQFKENVSANQDIKELMGIVNLSVLQVRF